MTTEAKAARPPAPLLVMAAPLMVSFTVRSLLTAVDLPYGAMLGDAAVAAMGLAFPLEYAFIAVWVGLSGAMTSHLSRAMGERSEQRLGLIVRATTRLVVAAAVLFSLFALAIYVGADHLDLDPAVATNFKVYASVVVAGAAIIGFWSVIPDSIVKAHHDTRSTMVAGLLSGGMNVVLNTLFMFVFDWGILGLAMATNLARLAGLAYALARARRLEDERRRAWGASSSGAPADTPAGLALARRPYRTLLVLAVPSSLAFVLMGAEGLIANAILTRFEGATASLAAFAIYHRTSLLLLMPVAGTGVAVVPFVARAIGEGRRDDVRRSLGQAFALAAAYGLALIPLSWLLGGPVARFLGDAPETERLAGFAVQLAAPLAVLVGAPFVLSRSTFEGLQRGLPGLLMAAVRYLCLSGPLGYAGATLATRAGHAPLHGLLAGILIGTALSSSAFAAWAWKTLRRL